MNKRWAEGLIVAFLSMLVTHFSQVSSFSIKMDDITLSCSKTIQSVVEAGKE